MFDTHSLCICIKIVIYFFKQRTPEHLVTLQVAEGSGFLSPHGFLGLGQNLRVLSTYTYITLWTMSLTGTTVLGKKVA